MNKGRLVAIAMAAYMLVTCLGITGCNTLKYEEIPFELEDNVLIIANTNKKRQLADSKYNERRAECEEVLKLLNEKGYKFNNLCEIKEEEMEKLIDKIYYSLPSEIQEANILDKQ